MAELDRRSIVLVVLAVFGATLLVASMQTAAIASQPSYSYWVSDGPITEATVEERLAESSVDEPRDDVVFQLENLSSHTRSALEPAFQQPGESVTVTGEGMAEPAFRYAGHAPEYGRGVYYVGDGEDYYRIIASATGSDVVPRIAGLVLTFLAIPLVLTTLYDADDVALSVSVLGGLAAATLLSWSGVTVAVVDTYLMAIGLGLATLFGTATIIWGLVRIVPYDVRPSSTRQRSKRHVLLSLVVAAAGAVAYLATTNSFTDGTGTATFFVALTLAFAIPGTLVWHGYERFVPGRSDSKPPT